MLEFCPYSLLGSGENPVHQGCSQSLGQASSLVRKQSRQPGGDCLEEPVFLRVLEKLCEAKRKDFLIGLGEGFGLADLSCEEEAEALACIALN